MNAFRDSEEFQRGRTGEQIVARWFQQHGWYVIPNYDYSGEDGDKAPKLQGFTDGYVLPDLGVSRSGKTKWVEVKTKTAPTFTRCTGLLEHGLPLRHWNHYLKVQAETGIPAWLCIVEESTGDVLLASMDDLAAEPGRPRIQEYQGTMAYFPRDTFKVLFNLCEVGASNETGQHRDPSRRGLVAVHD